MDMTNEEMYEAVSVMKGLEEKGKLGYAIAYNRRKMEECAKEYIEIKSKALQKYGEQIKTNDSQAMIKVPDKNRDAYDAEVKDISEIVHNVDIYKISLDDFIDGGLTSRQMEPLIWMVDE